jgi:hypothetical protein
LASLSVDLLLWLWHRDEEQLDLAAELAILQAEVC